MNSEQSMSTYRTRLISSRPARHEREATRGSGREDWDLDACRALLFAVLETAIRDYEYLRSVDGRSRFTESEKKKIRAMTEDNEPAEFFRTDWFDDLCFLLGLDPDAVRDVANLPQKPGELQMAG